MFQAMRVPGTPPVTLGEGPIWHDDRLYWVDIDNKRLFISNPEAGEHRAIQLTEKIGTVVPRARGGLAVALGNGFAFLDPATEKVEPIADPERDRPTRFNDGKCDPAGRFWAGTMGTDGTPGAGSLYMLDQHHQVHLRLTGVSCSNGICWSLDKRTMYYIDTPTHQVAAFDYQVETGAIANRRPIIAFERGKGGPDGMTMDERGFLWIALWGGWGVVCFDPTTGLERGRVKLPVSRVTACAFGGPNLDRLYITTASVGADRDAEPDAGSLYVAEVGVRGLPAEAYAG